MSGLVKKELVSTYELYTFGVAGHNVGVGTFHARAEMSFIFS